MTDKKTICPRCKKRRALTVRGLLYGVIKRQFVARNGTKCLSEPGCCDKCWAGFCTTLAPIDTDDVPNVWPRAVARLLNIKVRRK